MSEKPKNEGKRVKVYDTRSKSKNKENEEPNPMTNQKDTVKQVHGSNRVVNEAPEPNMSWAEETENTYEKGELPLQENPVQNTTIPSNEKSENSIAMMRESSRTNKDALTDKAESDDSSLKESTELRKQYREYKRNQKRNKKEDDICDTTMQTRESHNREVKQTEKRQILTSGITVNEEVAEILLAKEVETTESTSCESLIQDEDQNVDKNQNMDED
ncbi:8022_t:CDS:2 [Scutellospora calospora]|uniref:8022_t:CDS:1 n=1 Tax=Scutellospora calospora TaxID=85575 RepID=A0ACA9KN22_9GLOM|nr:8022_t:CDS:2 [Scutellospora calospora]